MKPVIPEQHWINEPTAAEWKRRYYRTLNWALAGWVGFILVSIEFYILISLIKGK